MSAARRTEGGLRAAGLRVVLGDGWQPRARAAGPGKAAQAHCRYGAGALAA